MASGPVPPIPAEVLARILVHVASIPGCHVQDHRMTREGGGPDNGVRTIEMRVLCRSPSLHAYTCLWRAPCPEDMSQAALVLLIQDRLREAMAVQIRRAEASIALGHAYPIPVASPDRMEVGHLHADASMLALLLEDYVDRAGPVDRHLGYIRYGVHELLDRTGRDPASTVLADDRNSVIERPDGLRLVEASLDFRARLGIDWLGPSGIEVPGTGLHPEQIMSALPGRPLGDLVQIDPLVDTRIIASAEQVETGIRVMLDPLPVSLSEYAGLEPRPALERLMARIQDAAAV